MNQNQEKEERERREERRGRGGEWREWWGGSEGERDGVGGKEMGEGQHNAFSSKVLEVKLCFTDHCQFTKFSALCVFSFNPHNFLF